MGLADCCAAFIEGHGASLIMMIGGAAMPEKKRIVKRLLRVLLMFCWTMISFGISISVAASQRLETVWISVSAAGDEGNDQLPACAVEWQKTGEKEYALLLPGITDWEETRIWFSGTDEIIINDTTYRNGDRISELITDGNNVVRDGKRKYNLLVWQGSAIGAAFVETASGSMKKINASTGYKEKGGSLVFFNPEGDVAFQGAMAHFKMRGNTAATLDKKNYGFKLKKGADLAGLGKAKRWVLLGNARDLTLLRNQICLGMARFVGIKYTPDAAPVDLYLNHRYNGCYLLSEKIEVNSKRVDIFDLQKANEEVNPEPLKSYPRVGEIKTYKRGKYKAFALPNNPDDISGGYILEYENYQPRYGSELCAYNTMRSKIFVFKDPEIVSVEEMEYASGMMQGYEDAIFSEDGKNPANGRSYWEYVDFESLVKKFMLEEVSMNTDGNGSSQYYFKPADSVSKVFFAGPAWDYDATFASFSVSDFQDRFLDTSKLLLTTVNKNRYYWPQLYAKEEFRDAVYKTWKDVYSRALRVLIGMEKDPSGQLLSLMEYAQQISESAEMNFIRWPILKKKNSARAGLTWAKNVDFLQNVLEQRYSALDQLWNMVDRDE